MKEYKRIIVIGDGWGTIAVLKGLEKFFLPICVVSNDEDVLSVAERTAEADLSVYRNELLIFAGYKPIVPKEVLENNTCINIHYSLLPKYRGFHSTVWAILNNEPSLGLTVHLMDEYVDNGPILHQYAVKNDFTSTSTDYMNCFNSYVESNIGEIIKNYIHDKIKPIAQNKLDASWVGKRNAEDCKIDFSRTISYQKAFFRALVEPYPLPYVIHKGQKIIVRNVKYHKSSVDTHIGRILNIDNDGVWVKIQDGYMVLVSMCDEKGKQYSIENFKIGQYLK